MASRRTQQLEAALGGRATLRCRVHHYRDFGNLVRAGLPHASLTHLGGLLGLRDLALAEVLGIPARTLARRTGGTLRPDESDRLFRVAKVYARAAEVLGDEAKAAHWLQEPNLALGDLTPLSLLDTEVGEDEVLTTLGRIEHGIVS